MIDFFVIIIIIISVAIMSYSLSIAKSISSIKIYIDPVNGRHTIIIFYIYANSKLNIVFVRYCN